MSKELIISSTSLEKRLAILEDDLVTEIFIEREQNRGILGNIYKGRVTKVLPGMQAAFVDIGLERNAFLYVADFFEDYDEYEELFTGSDAAVEDLLRRESAERDGEARASRRRRGGRRRGEEASLRPEGKRRPADPEVLIPGPQPLAPYLESWSESHPILPEYFVFGLPDPESWTVEAEEVLEEELEGEGGILPDRLEPLVGQAGPEPLTEDSEDQEARMENRSDLHFLSVTRNEVRRDSRKKERKNGRSPENGPLIGDLLKQGQEILVQVAKEPIGKKGARITSHVVLPGRYLVFMPTVDHIGVSRRIQSIRERQRLRKIIEELRGDFGRGFIVRTAGEGKTEEDFRQDMIYLTRLWDSIRAKAEKVSAPSLIHSELDLVQRVIRDYFSDEYRAIRVDDEQEYERIVEFISNFNPSLASRVRLYTKSNPIFDEYKITPEMEKALRHKVWLKTGGYIVINQTEALVSIDVNTGKYVGNTNSLEDTIFKTNLHAVKEVVRQIRLRDLGGIIVIDFIDMNEVRNREKVMEALQQELAKDKSPSKILQFNEFGLVTITRKRVKQSLERILCQPCPYCDGTGMTKSVRTVCYSIHQEVRRMLNSFSKEGELTIRCHPEVARALKGSERRVVKEIENMTGRNVAIQADALMHIEQFELVENA